MFSVIDKNVEEVDGEDWSVFEHNGLSMFVV
jgi:hypothetical protein